MKPMKKIHILTLLLFSLFLQAQNGKSRGKVEDVKKIIVEKANQLNLRPVNSNYEINYQQLSEETGGNFAYFVRFTNGAAVYCKSTSDKAFAVWGDIYMAYTNLINGSKPQYFLGAPTSDEFKTPNKNGAGQHFEGGSIYWSPATGAHEVHGAIKDKWAAMGWENSYLGFPVTDETATPDGFGRFNFFEGGAIYYHPHLGTFAVPRLIADVWKKEGWEKGKLGYPVSDEIIKNNNSVQYFEFGAVISTKASPYKVIYNSLRSSNGLYTKWRATGGVDSYLGDLVIPNKNYPKTHQYHFVEFQNGYIYENPNINGNPAFVIKKGPFFDYYASKKWETGYLGFPISDEIPSRDNISIQKFEGGTILYSPNTGAYEKK
jgi:uncharacterized protein with LGFP repeats